MMTVVGDPLFLTDAHLHSAIPQNDIEIIYTVCPHPDCSNFSLDESSPLGSLLRGCFANGRVRFVALAAKHGVSLAITRSFFTKVILNTKLLMTTSSLTLALVGIFAILFLLAHVPSHGN